MRFWIPFSFGYNRFETGGGSVKAISTHAHYEYHSFYQDISLAKLLGVTYPGWLAHFSGRAEDIDKLFDSLTGNGCFWYFRKAMGDIYHSGQIMTRENWREIDEALRARYREDPYFYNTIITGISGLQWVVLDEHRDPGDDHGLDCMRPSVRLDDWVMGNARKAEKDFDEYIENMEAFVCRRSRAVALKLAVAYRRGLDFGPEDINGARNDFARGDFSRTVQDAVAHRICDMAVRLRFPLQIHTGFGLLDNTRAMNLLPLIRSHPDTVFALLHISMPWTDDALALGRDLDNVYIDLSWASLLSVTRTARFIREAVELFPAHKLTWGCDTWTAEEGYGALMSARRAVHEALSGMDEEAELTNRIFYSNAKALYRL